MDERRDVVKEGRSRSYCAGGVSSIFGWRGRMLIAGLRILYRLLNMISVFRSARTLVKWELANNDFDSFFTYHDESCADVVSVLTNDRNWQLSHRGMGFPLHKAQHGNLSYSVDADCGGGVHFRAKGDASHWVYLVSSSEMPDAYAVEFDYVLNEEISESLQLCFFAESLADRYRFVLRDNRRMCFEVVKRGFWNKPLSERPMQFKIGERYHIRIEVVGRTFALLVNGVEVFVMRTLLRNAKPKRLFLIFWNGTKDWHPIDVWIDRFSFYTIGETSDRHGED